MITWIITRLTAYAWPLAAAGLAILLSALGWQTLQLGNERAGRAEDKAQYTEQRLLALKASAAEEAANRSEEQRRVAAQQKALDEAEQKATRARAAAAIADAAAGRLQQRIATIAAAAREAAGNPQAVQPGSAAEDPAGMLADVLGRCITRVRLLAAAADQRGTAGGACERSYDALTPTMERIETSGPAEGHAMP